MSENSRAKIRRFVMEFFSDEELTNLCFDYFPFVHNEFTVGMTKGQKVRLLIDKCERRGKLPDLRAALQRERPSLYDDQFAKEPPTPPPAPKPIRRNPRQIFISHAHQDADVAQRLAADLRGHGWEIWMAPDSIRVGEKWVEAINRGLAESGVFLLLLTPYAVNSPWVNTETNAAIGLQHRGKIRFLPLELERVEAPPLWEAYQWVSFRGGYEQGWRQLSAQFGIASRSVKEPTPQPIPASAPTTARIEISDAPAAQKQPQAQADDPPAAFVHPVTGNEMVFVPAGEFLFGNEKEPVHLDAFWIDKTPVTNAAYKRFLDANPQPRVPTGSSKKYAWNERTRTYSQGMANHPVVYVSWHDAQAYAAWANAALPTEQQWEKAARGTDGRTYPWGDDWRKDHANTEETGISGTTPVGQFSPQGDSPFGCVDMAGNVWEWTSSPWEAGSDPRVLRGGSWLHLSEPRPRRLPLQQHPRLSQQLPRLPGGGGAPAPISRSLIAVPGGQAVARPAPHTPHNAWSGRDGAGWPTPQRPALVPRRLALSGCPTPGRDRRETRCWKMAEESSACPAPTPCRGNRGWVDGRNGVSTLVHPPKRLVGAGRRGLAYAPTSGDGSAPSRPIWVSNTRARQAGDKVLENGRAGCPPVPPLVS